LRKNSLERESVEKFMKLDTRVLPDLVSLSRAALEETLSIVQGAVAKRGRFAIALSGGHTPAKMYSMWAQTDQYRNKTPWDRVHLFWSDERYVPADDSRSNYRMAREALISHVPIPPENVHTMPTNLASPEECARAYEAELRKFFGAEPPEFDVQLLGIGDEGHTASLFPGSPVLDEKLRWVVAVRVAAEPPQRLTLTPVVLNQGRNTFLLVAGEGKRAILSAIRDEPGAKPSQYPAARIRPATEPVWFLDQAAAG
jgi:6-phosphogluconolactonase